MPVEVAAATATPSSTRSAATGQIEAVQSVELRPEVDGRIVEILVREGQQVDAGTGLFKVDDPELKRRSRAPKRTATSRSGISSAPTVDDPERVIGRPISREPMQAIGPRRRRTIC